MDRISELDREHLGMIRTNVKRAIELAAEKFDGPGKAVLDIAPQDYEGAAEYFRRAEIYTLDIDADAKPSFVGDICKYNPELLDDSFDVVVCTEVLEHTLNPFDAIREIKRILKAGGSLVLTTPYNFRIHGPLPDCWRFTEHGLRELLKEYSEVEIREKESHDKRFLMPLQYVVFAKK